MKASSRFVRFSRFWVRGRFGTPRAGAGTSPLVRAPSLRASLIQIGMNCFSSCIGGPPCWKRGDKCGQIDDNRWSAIRQGGVPQSRNSLTWGFAEAFFSLRHACRKTARFSPSDHQLSCISPNLGAFSQQPPSANPLYCASLCLPRLAARNSSPRVRVPPRSAIVNNFAIFLNVGGCLLKSSSVCTLIFERVITCAFMERICYGTVFF